jgi:hypothetical protein
MTLYSRPIKTSEGVTLELIDISNGAASENCGYDVAVCFNHVISVMLFRDTLDKNQKFYMHRNGSKIILEDTVLEFAKSHLQKRWLFRATGIFLLEDFEDYSLLKLFLTA